MTFSRTIAEKWQTASEAATPEAAMKARPQLTLSVIIAAYNERPFVEEILRRVQAVGLVHEIVIVDDGSKDGTREWLAEMHRRQEAGETEAEIVEGEARLQLGQIRFLFQEHNQGKGQRCGADFPRRAATFCWCRMPIWNTTRAIMPNCWNRFWTGARTWCMGRDFWAGRSESTFSGITWEISF